MESLNSKESPLWICFQNFQPSPIKSIWPSLCWVSLSTNLVTRLRKCSVMRSTSLWKPLCENLPSKRTFKRLCSKKSVFSWVDRESSLRTGFMPSDSLTKPLQLWSAREIWKPDLRFWELISTFLTSCYTRIPWIKNKSQKRKIDQFQRRKESSKKKRLGERRGR